MHGADTREFLDNLNNLALLKLRQGQPIEGFMLSWQATTGHSRLMRTTECEVPLAIFTWGLANAALGRMNDAAKSLEKFQHLSKDRLAPDHPYLVETAKLIDELNKKGSRTADKGAVNAH